MNEEHRKYMRRAIELAEKGVGFVNPNPLVGAVIVKNGRIIGEGWHEYYGGWHAERNAFKNCTEDTGGATMYVTLEPCCHYGKTPPCTDAVIEHKIKRVVVGLMDPNPLVAGKGVEKLRMAGIEVITGVEEEALREQNKVFLKYITTRQPWIAMKFAATLDGKIAAYSGDSKWITGETARMRVQHLRNQYMGIMVGIGTVNIDDPILNCRLEGNIRQPVRIIVDSLARISENSRIVETARSYRTIIIHTCRAEKKRIDELRRMGLETLQSNEVAGKVEIIDMLRILGETGIDSILLEGGGQLNEAFIQADAVDEVYAFVAPKIIGGAEAKTPVEGKGFQKMSQAFEFTDVRVEMMGEDVLIRAGRKNK